MFYMPRQIRFNAFDMNCVAHSRPGLWRHPRDQSWRYKDLDYWTELAKLLERGRFDGIFIADVLGTYDVYGGSNEAAHPARRADPGQRSAAADLGDGPVTEHLGFGVTAGTAFEHPYPFARRMSTLDHLTKGRVGWNIVTGYCPRRRATSARRSARARRPLRPRRRVPRGALQAVGGLAGRTAPSSATASPASSPTRARSTRSATRARTSASRVSTCPSRRRSAPP